MILYRNVNRYALISVMKEIPIDEQIRQEYAGLKCR